MVDRAITQADLANLAEKLDDLTNTVTAREMVILLAVFALAGEAVNTKAQ